MNASPAFQPTPLNEAANGGRTKAEQEKLGRLDEIEECLRRLHAVRPRPAWDHALTAALADEQTCKRRMMHSQVMCPHCEELIDAVARS